MSSFWILTGPDGCVHGSADAAFAGRLPEDAHKTITPDSADRSREVAEGWRVEHVTDVQWDARADSCLHGRCAHRARPIP